MTVEGRKYESFLPLSDSELRQRKAASTSEENHRMIDAILATREAERAGNRDSFARAIGWSSIGVSLLALALSAYATFCVR